MTTRTASLSILTLAVLTATAVAAPKKKGATYIDPAKAAEDPDFAIQGEYVGELIGDDDEDHEKFGMQVIALGGGKFRLVAYEGGLPGAGWNGNKNDRSVTDGEMKDGAAIFEDDHGIGTLKDGVIVAKDDDDVLLGKFKKVERKSPTLGAKPPTGAVVLFDGTSPDNCKKGRMTEGGLLMEGVTSKQKFGDFTMHIEFLLPYKPNARGQARGNSGAYMQGRYEVQMLDSFGLEGKHNECGGIYSVKDPDINMCFPPLTWQTYDIDFTAAKFDDAGKKIKDAQMTVKHNGVVIHKDVKLPNKTTAAPVNEGAAPGPLYLQNHGNPVRYRNIWVVEKK
ncbi:MAG: DUF1080 domain-containing protein [Pirellulales bacterium]|nr:DUF1080 domain-containing protein [Pirellulales bacterium]